MNIVFRTDASIEIGTGHLMRCLALATELKQQGHQVRFICRQFDDDVASTICRQTKEKVFWLPTPKKMVYSSKLYASWLKVSEDVDSEQTVEVLMDFHQRYPKNQNGDVRQGVDLLIIDSYSLGSRWHGKVRPYTNKIMVIDDLVDRVFDCDILLNPNLGVQEDCYTDKLPADCKVLVGVEYALLRPEFLALRAKAVQKRESTQSLRKVLITMGGVDSRNYTLRILEQLIDEVDITVVLKRVSPNFKKVQSYISSQKLKNIQMISDAQNMSQLMLEADIAIGAAGSTSWERCYLGLPSLVCVIADNQCNVAIQLEKAGVAEVVHDMGSIDKHLYRLINNLELWKKMSYNGQSLCDGMGIQKTVRHLSEAVII